MRVGLYNGVYDCLHAGHVLALEAARKQCDYLIVAVNTDTSVKRLKGETRPIQDCLTRMMAVKRCNRGRPDAVIPFDGDRDALIMAIKPDILFVGYDHSAPQKLAWYERGWKNGGKQAGFAQVIQLPHLPNYSTTGMLNSCDQPKCTS
jgi:D-beta-D-heptose 7-phosphate kinase/D-beta-D-heptose 1-phosphate adenosyltransferase